MWETPILFWYSHFPSLKFFFSFFFVGPYLKATPAFRLHSKGFNYRSIRLVLKQNGSVNQQKTSFNCKNANEQKYQKIFEEKKRNKKFVQPTERSPTIFWQPGPCLWHRRGLQSGPVHQSIAQKGGQWKGCRGPATNSK